MTNSESPSIFNDVIGPVMRGPSSSHTAASWRIASISLQLLNDDLESALIELDREGVWASNFREQGTAMGMDGGLLGIDITDKNILETEAIARKRGISIDYSVVSYDTDHTNTVRLTLKGRSGRSVGVYAVSTGGGMFEIRKFEGQELLLKGDAYSCLYYKNDKLNQEISPHPFPDPYLEKLREEYGEILLTDPILPVISGKESECPYSDLNSLMEYAEAENLSLGEAGLLYESCRSGLGEDELIEMMEEIIRIIERSVSAGLQGTDFSDRILHQQSHLIDEAQRQNKILTGSLVNKLIANITALMEAKSAMELIVAVPTAGACGTFGGTLKAFCDQNKIDNSKKVMAYFAGGIIGVFFARGPGFSAEEHGCQVETGAAACMAAAALADASGGTAAQSTAAASMALQNTIGMICDPVADRVEVPCLGKNVNAGMNALAASSMALAGFDQVIPLDQVIQTVSQVGNMLPPSLCNTGCGGLAISPAAIKLKKKLANQ